MAPRSREDVSEYRELKRTLDRLTGKINGKYAEFDWVPLRYMTHGLTRKVLAGFFRLSAIGLVTPLRTTEHQEALGMDVTQHGEEAYVTGEGAILITAEAGVGSEVPVRS